MLTRQVLQLIRCMCGSNNVESTSKCSRRCSCNRNSLVCTELCNCAEDDKCQNTEPMLIALDTNDGKEPRAEHRCPISTRGHHALYMIYFVFQDKYT